MATEKILNTKVLLRYDTLAHWQATDKVNAGANYLPKKGEACVYEIPTGASVDGVKNPPAIMIKVGDGTNKISALPWTAATAADVYAWAKKSGIEIEEGTGDYITGLSWNSITNKIVVAKASFDNSGNVKFSKTEAGNVKATVSISDVKVDNALHAETADSATEAGKATNDGAGNNIVNTYATKAEIEANRNLWTQDTVTKVTDDDKAIEVSTTDTLLEGSDITYTVKLKINNSTPGNVTLTQDANGLKANTTPAAIGAQPAGNYKTTQTAVADKITKDNHILTSLTQNANGVISYEVKELTPAAIGAQPAGNYQPAGDYQPAGNYKTKQTAVTTPTANGNATAFIDTITQNENGEITITKKNITAADLGLDKAISFLGTSTTAITDGGSEKPTIEGETITPASGNVVLYGNQEYIYNTLDKWELFGDEGSYALKTTSITANNGLTSTAKLDGTGSIGIADNGVTTAKIDAKAVTTTKINDSAVTATQIASDAVVTAKIKDGNVTKAKLHSDIQTSLDKADSALQEVKWLKNNSADDTYLLNTDASITIPSKAYVDDAVAGVVAGNVAYAAKAGHATTADYATTAGKATNDGNGKEISKTYKVKQTTVSDPTASGKSLTFIDSISQNTEGVITATKKEVNLDAYALKTDIPEIPDIVITETKGALGSAGTIFVSGKLEEDTATGHTISQPMFGLTQNGDIEFITAEQTIEQDVNTTTAVSFAIKDKAVTAEKTAAYTTENTDGTHTASTEVWVLFGGSATENI